MDLENIKIGILGSGNMARALVRSWRYRLPGKCLAIASPTYDKAAKLAEEFEIERVYTDNRDCFAFAETLILACKPQQWRAALKDFPGMQTKAILSFMAGVSTASIREQIGSEVALYRCMCNLGIGSNSSLICYSKGRDELSNSDTVGLKALQILGEELLAVEEDLMHAITALLGSGPAFIILMHNALVRAGESAGLPKTDADKMSRAAINYASQRLTSGTLAADIIKSIASKGGTTSAGLIALDDENGNINTLMAKAIDAAIQRGQKLDQNLTN